MTKFGAWIRLFKGVVLGVSLLSLMAGCAGLPVSLGGSEKGVFMDGPVGGLSYQTPSLKGVTKADGVFRYKPGETVTFKVGNLVLGSAPGKAVVTPLDLFADAKNASDQRVVNVSVFLQTLDQDGNPENGIVITKQAADFVNRYGMETDFNKHPRRFSFDAGLRTVLAELNNVEAFPAPRAVRPPGLAQKHLEATLESLKK